MASGQLVVDEVEERVSLRWDERRFASGLDGIHKNGRLLLQRQGKGREQAGKLTLPTQPITQEGSVLRSCSTTPDGKHVPSCAAVLRTCGLSVTRINASYQWLSVPLVTEEQSHLS